MSSLVLQAGLECGRQPRTTCGEGHGEAGPSTTAAVTPCTVSSCASPLERRNLGKQSESSWGAWIGTAKSAGQSTAQYPVLQATHDLLHLACSGPSLGKLPRALER